MTMAKLGVLVLAAGLSTRLGGPNKLLKMWRDKPLVSHVFALANEVSSYRQVAIVHRDSEQVCALLPDRQTWTIIDNPHSATGLASSLKLGLAAFDDCEGVMVLLGDMPAISSATLLSVVSHWSRETYAVVPVYKGQWGNPVLLGRAAIADCQKLVGDQGAKKLLLSRQDSVTIVATLDPAILADFDVAADFDDR
jgi:molybdenum cofactor cytidylyltransferase